MNLTDDKLKQCRLLRNGIKKTEEAIHDFTNGKGIGDLSEQQCEKFQLELRQLAVEIRATQARSLEALLTTRQFERLRQLYVQSLMMSRRRVNLIYTELGIELEPDTVKQAIARMRTVDSEVQLDFVHDHYWMRRDAVRSALGNRETDELFGFPIGVESRTSDNGSPRRRKPVRRNVGAIVASESGSILSIRSLQWDRCVPLQLILLPTLKSELKLKSGQMEEIVELQKLLSVENGFGTGGFGSGLLIAELQADKQKRSTTRSAVTDRLKAVLTASQLKRFKQIYAQVVMMNHDGKRTRIDGPLDFELSMTNPGTVARDLDATTENYRQLVEQRKYDAFRSIWVELLGEDRVEELLGSRFSFN